RAPRARRQPRMRPPIPQRRALPRSRPSPQQPRPQSRGRSDARAAVLGPAERCRELRRLRRHPLHRLPLRRRLRRMPKARKQSRRRSRRASEMNAAIARLSPPRQRALAVTLAVVAIVAVLALVLGPLVLLHKHYDDTIAALSDRLDRYRRV